MSYQTAYEPVCTRSGGSIALFIRPQEKDLGEFSVRRILPAGERRMVGPFVFFDHMGPAEFPPGKGITVRPHPHIGIATITYLFEGEIMHRDSLGFVQPITPGAVNLMVAGSGIVHSERAGSDLDVTSRLHGIQSWIALPTDREEMAPAFTHYRAADLPELQLPGARVRIIMGEAYGERSAVATFSRTLYLDIDLQDGAELVLPDTVEELAFYVADGSVQVDGTGVEAGVMAVACPGKEVVLRGLTPSRILVVGGDNIGTRRMFWNFVSTAPERIHRAKRDWREGQFAMVPGDDEFIPLPE